jgi:hypothetical protein
MNVIGKFVLFGFIGGLIGAGIWAVISYGTGSEIGWIAWGIGFLVGFGVRLGAQEQHHGVVPGAVAVGIALMAIVLGKYMAVRMIINKEMSKLGLDQASQRVDVESIKLDIADEIVLEYEAKKKKINWQKSKLPKNFGDKPFADEFPPEIWKEANRRYEKLTPAEKEVRIAASQKSLTALVEMTRGKAMDRGFAASFGPFDALWFLLASLTAFRVGSGTFGDD